MAINGVNGTTNGVASIPLNGSSTTPTAQTQITLAGKVIASSCPLGIGQTRDADIE